jgi:ribose-phosphate pyrophosphokinase
VAVVSKTRPRPDQVEVGELIGHVHDRTAIIGDDMIVTGSTLLAAVRAVRGAGASDVVAFATHAAFAGDALERLLASDLAELIVTDTVPIDPAQAEERLTVLSIAPLLAQTIEHVFSEKSVSALFGGQEVF